MASNDRHQKGHQVSDEPIHLIFRLSRSAWPSKGGIQIKTSLTLLKKKSAGFNLFEEDISQTTAMDVADRITNLSQCEDGVYQLVMCNQRRDYETGNIEEWDYKLLPADQPAPVAKTVQSLLQNLKETL